MFRFNCLIFISNKLVELNFLIFLFFIIIKSITVNLSFEIKKDIFKVLLYFFILLGLAQLFLLISLKIGYDFLPVSTQDFLKNQQEFNSKLQEGFITNTLSGFLFNLLLLAIIPAIGEELFFRGILQKKLRILFY